MKEIEIQFPGVKALDKVDFNLRAGEIHSLLGENGAGKSTLIKCLTGVNHMDAGVILLDGKEIRPQSPQHAIELGISTVYQEVNLCPNLTVAENIFVGRQPMRRGQIDWKTINSRARELMARFHQDIDVTRPLSYYSTAVQQMVAIARAVDVQAKILILDEPTSSLDDNEVSLLFNVMNELKAEGLGIIFITHFLDQVYAVSDRMTILRNGHLVGTYGVEELSRVELVTLMVGKDIDTIFNLKRAEVPGDAPYMLKATHIGAPGQVDDITVTLKKGELIGFAGLLGSGRTETAELLFGAKRLASGELEVDGQKADIRSPYDALMRGMAFCPEDRKRDGIIGDLSIRENIALAVQARRGFLRPLSRAEQNELADKYIKALGIATPDAEKKIGELSGGNQQKVILARWLLTHPKYLILDEPTRGIDVGTKTEIQRLVLKLAEEGMSVTFISSEIEEMLRTCSRLIVMRDRNIVGQLTGDELTQSHVMHTIAGGGGDNE